MKYDTFIKILDTLSKEAPKGYKRWYELGSHVFISIAGYGATGPPSLIHFAEGVHGENLYEIHSIRS
jgi:hypothetical protein